jgi:hypothetical protein
MSSSKKAADWQALSIVTMGGAAGVGAEVIFFQFRSKEADYEGTYLFLGAGLGAGGSLGGAIAPSPSDFANGGHNINLWSDIKSKKPFSGDDLDATYLAVDSASFAGAYGYSVMLITAGTFTKYFSMQNVGGWGVGVGVTISGMGGILKRLSHKTY